MYMNFLEELSKRAVLIKNEGDYYKDGLLHCGVCGEPKQAVKDVPFAGRTLIVTLQCRCEREKEEKERLALLEYERQQRIKYLFKIGVTSEAYKSYTFANDDRRNIEVTKLCCNYIRHFEEMKKLNNGILFYGEVGKGKTFYAGCIANALIQRGIPVLITSLSNLVQNRIKAMNNKAVEISLKEFECFVLDDIGTENATQTAFNIIDEIYLLQKPLIVTTNLTPSQLKQNEDSDKRRMYDRIIELCGTKQLIESDKSRLMSGNEKGKTAYKILNS